MVVLGLGTNLGDRLEWLVRAIRLLTIGEDPILRNTSVSPIYISDALLLPGSPQEWNLPFYNIALGGQTDLEPKKLLEAVKSIESQVGREQRGRWAPREVDIDILTFNEEAYTDSTLTIPHPALLERPFALYPLTDLDPYWTDPRKTMHERKQACELSDLLGSRFSTLRSSRIPCRTAREELSVQTKFKEKIADLPVRFEDGTSFGTSIIGILNLTPDSFSDGGRFSSIDSAIFQAEQMLRSGAKIIDIGAESTRPDGVTITSEEEWNRLQPVLSELKGRQITLSIDTRNVEVAKKANEFGVSYINDVSGLRSDEMVSFLASESHLKIITMHSLTVPVVREIVIPKDKDPIQQLCAWINESISRLAKSGIDPKRLIFDPGIGFGKTADQSWEILRRIGELVDLGYPIAVGHSRKSFLSAISDRPPQERDLETAAISVNLARSRVKYLRVHDPLMTKRALQAAALSAPQPTRLSKDL